MSDSTRALILVFVFLAACTLADSIQYYGV